MNVGLLIAILVISAVAVVELFVLQKNLKIKKDLTQKEEDAKHKIYEIAILNELSEKMDYSLSVQNVAEIIIGSLHDFVNYTVASYMVMQPEKIVFRSYIEKPVSGKFVSDIKTGMLNYASDLLKVSFKDAKIEETLWGQAINDELDKKVGSFFNIPLVISGKVVGILNITDVRDGFYKEKEVAVVNGIVQQATKAVTRLQGVIESEKSKLNAMVASMTDGVVMTDKDFNVLVVNPAAKHALGVEDKKDLSILDVTDKLQGKIDLKDKIEESVRLEKIFLSEEISLASGFFKIVVSPVKDNWKMLGCVVVFRDITRKKEIEKIKEDFTSMIVHELRSPLDSIKKMTEMMRTIEVSKAKRTECLQMIYGSSSDMLELITNLLDIAKVEAGKFELAKQKTDIRKTIASRILFFDVSSKDAKVKISTQFGKDLPEAVDFDPRTISQVLNNLISNAVKFTKENGDIIIQVLSHKKGNSVAEEAKEASISWFIKKDFSDMVDSLFIAVTDNGIGIAPDQADKLFNKFSQAKNIFVEKGGTGLGLAITKSIVDSHGGIVGAESVEGQGSTFYFTLPASPSQGGPIN